MTDIHDLFHTNAPAEPTTQGWSDEVRARRGRRRTVGAVAGGGLALAAAVGVAAVTIPGTTTLPPADLPAMVAADVCAKVPDLTATFNQEQGEDLREGAKRLWLCGDDMDAAGMGARGPLDPLTVGVDKAFDWYAAAPVAPLDRACTMEYRLTYTAVFEYADGTLMPVVGELHGCKTVTDGSTVKEGGQEFYDLLTGLWADQREVTEFTAPAQEPCSAMRTVIAAKPGDAVAGSLCTADDQGKQSGPAIDADLAKRIGESIAADSTPAGADMEFGQETVTLLLQDRFGDAFSLTRLDDGSFSYFTDDSAMVWTPPAELAEAIAALS